MLLLVVVLLMVVVLLVLLMVVLLVPVLNRWFIRRLWLLVVALALVFLL
jgi:hypothetical protein